MSRLSDRLNAIIAQTEGKSLAVGFMSNATYDNGDSVAGVAADNEYGVPAKHQPPRPFFRQMIAIESSGWTDKIANALILSNYDADKALDVVGEDIKGALIESINTLMTPPLAASTIAKKGFSKPLIDTSHMVNSITFEVRDGD